MKTCKFIFFSVDVVLKIKRF